MSNKLVLAAGEAMPKGPSPEYTTAWQKCRALGKELSVAIAELSQYGDSVYACVMPVGSRIAVTFLEMEPGTVASMPELPVDRVNRLSSQLAHALDDWQEHTHMPFKAHVPPASAGQAFYFENMQRDRDLPKGSQAVQALADHLAEAGRIIRSNPDLKVDRISVNEHGVYTFQKIPGVSRIAEGDI